jgi:hypothetical protein
MRKTNNPLKSIPTHKLKEFLDHANHQGTTGADYGTNIEALQQELWRRQNEESEKALKLFEQQQKEYFKHQAASHKRKKD